MTLLDRIGVAADRPVHTAVDGVADGYEGFALAQLVSEIAPRKPLIFVARDGQRLGPIAETLRFAQPKFPILELPGWDCLPYDRVSPSADAAARRLDAMAAIAHLAKDPHGAVILTTVNALLQRMPPAEIIAAQGFTAKPGNRLNMEALIRQLETSGFERVSSVREMGDYAVRGGILDLFAPGAPEPLRLDFFGDTLESIRAFDLASQRTIGQRKALSLQPMSEVALTDATITHFRKSYIEAFGAPSREDALYAAVSEGRRFAGLEHWLPMFYDRLDTLFDYLPDAPVVFDHLARQSADERYKVIADHYDSRKRQQNESTGDAVPYKPVAPNTLYLSPEALDAKLADRQSVTFSAYDVPETSAVKVRHGGAFSGKSFAEERADPNANVFAAVVKFIAEERAAKRKVLIACWSEGSLDRLTQILAEHGLENLAPVASLKDLVQLEVGKAGLCVLSLEQGFRTESLTVVAEQDILGDRLVRRQKKRKKGSDFISEVSALAAGDIVVHTDHGIGRFIGLRTIEALGAPHDCLELHYAGDDRLFLPVENIELLSRFGSDAVTVALDRLGGAAWQARKAKLKKRLLDMAGDLIKIAAARQMRAAPKIVAPEGLYGEFAARFPYEETDDQLNAIEAVVDDLGAGRPMDRLICGDVGFGKTEVALRAAFIAAMEGFQVAIVVPTTLLSRQHFKTFTQRFQNLPLNIRQASRLVPAKELAETKKGLADGTVDIVVGTHALLGKTIDFARLGLLVIDEEQHFGVKHKERLKELKSDIHVLTLSATPIPRTLQLALTGVRELSLIATPPVDRMAVRTFVSPFDPLVIRETLLREHYRGGQSFYVVPRISDLAEIHDFLKENVPELKVAIANGQMPAGELDDIMNAFYDGQYDILLSTTIVESGLDVPTANTMIVHRADMFGLAQLYQLRGRVGRSKVRAYALLTLPANRKVNMVADRRLKVLQSLDTLGAGFQLASHDLDIRGAGNLLGEEQSGHIKEVGFELYQQMLEEAVAELQGVEDEIDSGWSPQISVGAAVMIPESYVPDLQLRLSLYRRLGDLSDASEIDGFGAEMIDRFGPLPTEVDHLLKVVFIKALCRKANVEKLDAGPKGIVIQFRHKNFPNPAGLVAYISAQGNNAKIRPDQSVFLARELPTEVKRLTGAAMVMTQLAKIAGEG